MFYPGICHSLPASPRISAYLSSVVLRTPASSRFARSFHIWRDRPCCRRSAAEAYLIADAPGYPSQWEYCAPLRSL